MIGGNVDCESGEGGATALKTVGDVWLPSHDTVLRRFHEQHGPRAGHVHSGARTGSPLEWRSAAYTCSAMKRFAASRRGWLAALLVGMLAVCATACGSTPQDAVHVLKADSEVGPVMEQYIDRGISRAEDNDAKAVVIEIDTPGGLDTSMRDIVQRIEPRRCRSSSTSRPPGAAPPARARSSRWPRTSP